MLHCEKPYERYFETTISLEGEKSVTILIHYLQNPMVHQVKGTRTINSPVTYRIPSIETLQKT